MFAYGAKSDSTFTITLASKISTELGSDIPYNVSYTKGKTVNVVIWCENYKSININP